MRVSCTLKDNALLKGKQLLHEAQLITNCPHNGGQYFAERQSIQMNKAAARSTAVTIVVDNTLLKGKVFK
jgi:hypothetical protein